MNDEFGDEQDSSQPPSEITGRVPELNAEQREIHQNLKNIGEGMAAFYLDGLKILHDPNLQTAASLLGHIAKEIDSGLKHLLPPKEDVNKIGQMLGKNFGFAPPRILASLHLDIDSLQSSTPLTNQDKARIENRLRERELHRSEHIASILTSLNLDIDNLPSQRITNRMDIAIRWIDVSTRFNDFDHQHGVGEPPRHLDEFIPLWEIFEGVLGNLVGSYLNFLFHVIDPILKHKVPTKEIENSLPNMVKLDPLEAGPRYRYFFEQLPHRRWLEPLSNIGYFNPKYNPPPQEIPDEPGYYRTPVWYALEYAVKVANQIKNQRSGLIVKTLVQIIDAIIKSVDDNGERIENEHTDLQTIKIMGTLSVDLLEPQHITFMGTALKSKWKSGSVDQEISQTILPRLLDSGKQELTLELLKIMLEVKSVDGRIHPIMDGYWLEGAFKEHGQAIANLCGVEAAQTALSQIQVLAAADAFTFHFIQLVDSDLSRFSQADYTELIVSFTSNIFQSVDPESIEETVQSLLQKPYAISRRIAVKAITDHYSHLKHLFWEWEGNPLDEVELKPEMYELIQTNSHDFSEVEMEQILQWIESTQD